MVKVKLTEKLDSEILVVGFGTVDKKLKIEAGPSQIDTAALLATLIAMGASGKADEVIKLPGKNCKIIAFTGLGEIGSGIEVETYVGQQGLLPENYPAIKALALHYLVNQ